ncbi:MAG: DinB family protein, partial [Betaproteobacteria bacterium]|nr:DinB family protein [Betaproteobacteria bacterium]
MLERLLLESRARTELMTRDLDGARLLGPKLGIVNPPLWEIGHVAWFQERWCLRMAQSGAPLGPSILEGADALYDSSAVAHDTRWDLPLPGLEATRAYMAEALERVRA